MSAVSPPIEGLCTIGWRIEQMKIRDTRPADFAAFWNQRKAELAKIPLKPQEGTFKTFKGKEIDSYNLASAALPGDYDPLGHKTDQVESAKVSFSSVQGNRVYGWLAKPAGKGPFPAMLVLPGAGFAARPMPLEHARHGYVALDIQVHGQDVDQKEYPPIPGHNDNHVYQPVEAYYYSRVYLNALQAVSYLASRPDVDPKRIVVVGGSQGGRLSVVAAALDHRIRRRRAGHRPQRQPGLPAMGNPVQSHQPGWHGPGNPPAACGHTRAKMPALLRRDEFRPRHPMPGADERRPDRSDLLAHRCVCNPPAAGIARQNPGSPAGISPRLVAGV